MNLLLTSDFYYVGSRYLKEFFKDFNGKTCLFVGYAEEDDAKMYESQSKTLIQDFGFKVIDLKPDYDFSDKIDMIYVRGGNTTKLIHYLHEFGQFDKIRQLVEEDGVLYVGLSAGSVIAGNDTKWTLRSEPYGVDLRALYGKDAYNGFGWLNKMIFVHDGKYRLPYSDEPDFEKHELKENEFYNSIRQDKKLYPKKSFIPLKNNQVLIKKGEILYLKTTEWSTLLGSQRTQD